MNSEKSKTQAEMKKEVLKHWSDMQQATVEELRHAYSINAASLMPFSEGCAFCEAYALGRDETDMCVGCPIAEHTGYDDCEDTPYYVAVTAFRALMAVPPETDGYRHIIKCWHYACGLMLMFIEGLEVNDKEGNADG
jgi:hypothetical protein